MGTNTSSIIRHPIVCERHQLINNNDVKCSHGTSIGPSDQEQLFYAVSRGIPEAQARKMIVEGFFEPLVAALEVPDVADQLRDSISQKLKD